MVLRATFPRRSVTRCRRGKKKTTAVIELPDYNQVIQLAEAQGRWKLGAMVKRLRERRKNLTGAPWKGISRAHRVGEGGGGPLLNWFSRLSRVPVKTKERRSSHGQHSGEREILSQLANWDAESDENDSSLRRRSPNRSPWRTKEIGNFRGERLK